MFQFQITSIYFRFRPFYYRQSILVLLLLLLFLCFYAPLSQRQSEFQTNISNCQIKFKKRKQQRNEKVEILDE